MINLKDVQDIHIDFHRNKIVIIIKSSIGIFRDVKRQNYKDTDLYKMTNLSKKLGRTVFKNEINQTVLKAMGA